MPSIRWGEMARRRFRLAAIAAAGFFLLGWGALLIWNGSTESSSPVWPATAFGFCLILRQSRCRADDLAMLAAMLPAGLAANALHGAGWPLNLGFSVINLLDMIAGLVAVRGLGIPRFSNWGAAARFTLIAAISPALTGAIFAGLLIAFLGGDGRTAALQWFIANVLGVCILFPLGMTVSRRQLTKLKLTNRGLEATVVFATVAATAALTFHFAGFHMQFLALVAAGAAAVRFRLLGAGVALMTIAVIALAAPVAQWSLTQIWLLQIFLAVCSGMAVRVAMLMNERDMHIAVIERGRRRALRASRFKSQLLAHVSHEVRTPLSAVVGFSGMLETGALSAERAPEFASIIVHNGELLQRLHDDLLDLSQAEAGALSLAPETVLLSNAIFTCVGGIRLDTALGGKHLVVDPIAEGLAVRADPVRLAQIVNNLIANAYKYGDNRSPIRISAAATQDGFGRIEIVNAGPGIPPEERGNLFRPFSRAQGVGRSVPGAGLGLSIAKLLVEMQGGRIDFDSTPEQTTRFWVDLPLATAQALDAHHPAAL